ncbi:uncharacterized protein LOC124138047 [Haliotis rufescens]|uniref:uncharacterized protein LOC124138047 n=1 Tax=Haliotis rufescens TaxID=6454 RepID=UPI00201EFF2D|nr:uncharacterized protein LOC124138047 [Haliotis rufescens]
MKRAGDDSGQLPCGGVRSRGRCTKSNRISLRPTFVSPADESVETSQTDSHAADAPPHHVPSVRSPPRHPGSPWNQWPPSQQRQSGRRIMQARIVPNESVSAEYQPTAMKRQATRIVPTVSQPRKTDSRHLVMKPKFQRASVLGVGEVQSAGQTNQRVVLNPGGETLPRSSTSQLGSQNLTKSYTRLPDRSKIQNKWSRMTSRTSTDTQGFIPLKESVILNESPVCVIEANLPVEEPAVHDESPLILRHSDDQVEVIDTHFHPLCHAETSSRSGFFLPTPRNSPDRDFLVPSRPAQKKWRSTQKPVESGTSKSRAKKLKRIEDTISIPCSNQIATSRLNESTGSSNVLFKTTETIQFGSFPSGCDHSKQMDVSSKNPVSRSPKTLSDNSPKSISSSDCSPLQPKVMLQNISKFLSTSESESGYSGCVSADSLDLALGNMKGTLDYAYNQDRNCYSDTDSEIMLNRDRKKKHRSRKKSDKPSAIKDSIKPRTCSNRLDKVNDGLAGSEDRRTILPETNPQQIQVSRVADLNDFDSDDDGEGCNLLSPDNFSFGSEGDGILDQPHQVPSFTQKVNTKACIRYSSHRHASSESRSEASDSNSDSRRRKIKKLSVKRAEVPSELDPVQKKVLIRGTDAATTGDSVSSRGKNNETACVSKTLARSVAEREHLSESSESDTAREVRHKKQRKCNVSKAESGVRTSLCITDESESQDEKKQTAQTITFATNTYSAVGTSGWRIGTSSHSSDSDMGKGKKNVSVGRSKQCKSINPELQDGKKSIAKTHPTTVSSHVSTSSAQTEIQSVVSETSDSDFSKRKNKQLNSQTLLSESSDSPTRDRRKITEGRSEISHKKKFMRKKKADEVGDAQKISDTNKSSKTALDENLSQKGSSNQICVSPCQEKTSSSTDTAETEGGSVDMSSDDWLVSSQSSPSSQTVLEKTWSEKHKSLNPSVNRIRASKTAVPEAAGEGIRTVSRVNDQILTKGYAPKTELSLYPKARRKPLQRMAVSEGIMSQFEPSISVVSDHKSGRVESVPPGTQADSLIGEGHNLVQREECVMKGHSQFGKSVENVSDSDWRCRDNMHTSSSGLSTEGTHQSQAHETPFASSKMKIPAERKLCSKSPLLQQMLTSENYNLQQLKAVDPSDDDVVNAQQSLTGRMEAGVCGDDLTVPAMSWDSPSRRVTLCGRPPAPVSRSVSGYSVCDQTGEENQLESILAPSNGRSDKHRITPANPVCLSETEPLSMDDESPMQNIPGSDRTMSIFSETDSDTGSSFLAMSKCGSKDPLRLSTSLWKKVVPKRPRGRPRKVQTQDLCPPQPQVVVPADLCIPLYRDVRNNIVWRPEYNNACHQGAFPLVVMPLHNFERRAYHMKDLEDLGIVSKDIKITKPSTSVDLTLQQTVDKHIVPSSSVDRNLLQTVDKHIVPSSSVDLTLQQTVGKHIVVHETLGGDKGIDEGYGCNRKGFPQPTTSEAPALGSPSCTEKQIGHLSSPRGPVEVSTNSSDVVHVVPENLGECVDFLNTVEMNTTEMETGCDIIGSSEHERSFSQFQTSEVDRNKEYFIWPKEQSVEMRTENDPVNISSTMLMLHEIVDDLLPLSVRRNEGQSPVSELSSATSSKSVFDKDVFDCEVSLDDSVKTDDLCNEGIAIVNHLVREFLPIPDTVLEKDNIADKAVETSVKKIKTVCSSLSKILHTGSKSLQIDSSPDSGPDHVPNTSQTGLCVPISDAGDQSVHNVQNKSKPATCAFTSEANKNYSDNVQDTSSPCIFASISKADDQTRDKIQDSSISSVPVSIQLTGLDLSALLENNNPDESPCDFTHKEICPDMQAPSAFQVISKQCHNKNQERNAKDSIKFRDDAEYSAELVIMGNMPVDSHRRDISECTADAEHGMAKDSMHFSGSKVGTDTDKILDCRRVVSDGDTLCVQLDVHNHMLNTDSVTCEDTEKCEFTGGISNETNLDNGLGVCAGKAVVKTSHVEDREGSDRLGFLHSGHGVRAGEAVVNTNHVEDREGSDRLGFLHSGHGVRAGDAVVNTSHVEDREGTDRLGFLHSGHGVRAGDAVVNTDHVEDREGTDRLGFLHSGHGVRAGEAVVNTNHVEDREGTDRLGCLLSGHGVCAGDAVLNTNHVEDREGTDRLRCVDKSQIDAQAVRLGVSGSDLQPRLILFCLSMKRFMKFGRHKYRRIGGKRSQTWKVRLKRKYRKKQKSNVNHSFSIHPEHSKKYSIKHHCGPDLSMSERSTCSDLHSNLNIPQANESEHFDSGSKISQTIQERPQTPVSRGQSDVTDFGLAISTPKEKNKRKPKKDTCVSRKGSGVSQKQGVSLTKPHHDLETMTHRTMPESKLAQSILKKEEERRKRAAAASQHTYLDLPALVPFEQIMVHTDQTACSEKEGAPSTSVSSVMSLGESANLFSPPRLSKLKKIRKKAGSRSSEDDMTARSPLERSYEMWSTSKYDTGKRTSGIMNSSFTDKQFTFGSSVFDSPTFHQEVTSPVRPAVSKERPGTESVKESLLCMLEGTGALCGESPSSSCSNSSRRKVSVTISPIIDTAAPAKKAREILSPKGILKSPVSAFVPKGFYKDTMQSDVETEGVESMVKSALGEVQYSLPDIDDESEAEKVTFLVSPSSPDEATLAVKDMEPESEAVEVNTGESVQAAGDGADESSRAEVDESNLLSNLDYFDNTDLSAMEKTVGFIDNLLSSDIPSPRNQMRKSNDFSEDDDLESKDQEPDKVTMGEDTLMQNTDKSVASEPNGEQRSKEPDDGNPDAPRILENSHGECAYASLDEKHDSDSDGESEAGADSCPRQTSEEKDPDSKSVESLPSQDEISEKSEEESDQEESDAEDSVKPKPSDEDGNSDADSDVSGMSLHAPSEASFLSEEEEDRLSPTTTENSTREELKDNEDFKFQEDLELQDNHDEEDMDLSSGCSIQSGPQPEPAIPPQVVQALGVPEGYCVNFVRNSRCKHSPCKYKHGQPSKEVMISMVFKDLQHLMSTNMHHHMFAKFHILARYCGGDVAICGEVLQCMLRWAMQTGTYSQIDYLLSFATKDPNLLLYAREAIQVMVQVMQNPLKEDVKPACFHAVSGIFNRTCSRGLILSPDCLTQLLQLSLQTLMLQDVVIYCQQQKHAVPSSIMQVALLSQLHDVTFREKAELILQIMSEKSMKALGLEIIEKLSTVPWSPERETQHKVMRVYHTMTVEPAQDLDLYEEDEEQEEVQTDSEDYRGIYHRIAGCRQSMNWKYLARIYLLQCTSDALPNSKFLRVYVDVLHDKQDSLKTAIYFHAFLNNVFNKYQKEITKDALLSLDRRTLARIGFHLLVRTFKSPPYGQCCTLVADLLDNRLPCKNLQPEMGYTFHSTVVEVCLQMSQLERLLQFIQGLCPTEVYTHGAKERPDLWHDQLLRAISLLCSKSCLPEAADVLAFFKTQLPKTEAVLTDHHREAACQLMELALCHRDLDTAVKVFDLAKTVLQFNHLRHLLIQCFLSNMRAKAGDIFILLRPDLTKNNSQNLIVVNNSFHFTEIEMIICAHLVDLYHELCQLKMSEGHTPTDDNLALTVTVDDDTNPMPKTVQDTTKEVRLIFRRLGVDSHLTVPRRVVVDIHTLKEYMRGCDEQARNLGLFPLSPEESQQLSLYESQGRSRGRGMDFTKVRERGQYQSRGQGYIMRGQVRSMRSQSHDRYPGHSIRGQSHDRGQCHSRGQGHCRGRGRYHRGQLHNR